MAAERADYLINLNDKAQGIVLIVIKKIKTKSNNLTCNQSIHQL